MEEEIWQSEQRSSHDKLVHYVLEVPYVLPNEELFD